MSEHTLICRPLDVVSFWWTGCCRLPGQTRVGQEFTVRTGHFRGSIVELVCWIMANIELMRAPQPTRVTELAAYGAEPTACVRIWGNASEMLLAAARALESLVPSLVPMPYGFGVLYSAGELTAEDMAELRSIIEKKSHLRLESAGVV